jgi:hypothetical protein
MDVSNVSEVMKNFSGDNGMPVGIDTAIKALRPGCRFEIEMAGGNITYHKWYHEDGLKPPTKAEIDVEMAYQEKLAKHYQYAYDRCKHYPDGFEQLDMLWHTINEGKDLKDSEWLKTIKEVKEKYPKPTEPVPTKD